VTRVRVASDWHLGPRSPAGHGRLALAFLARARADGARVILNGDVWEDLFAGAGAGRRAFPDVAAAADALAAEGRLVSTRGNHDPESGERQVELDWPGLGRVLVAHGHAADPVNASPLGRLGDGISRRFGRLGLVRGAAWLAEAAVRGLLEDRVVALFAGRCRRLTEAGGYALGVFGHVHRPHLAPGDRYANAGSLHGSTLEYLELGPDGPRLATLGPADLTEHA
jgi:UDP-2,3-diacylglucosamine pyrophosphatase LpxH